MVNTLYTFVIFVSGTSSPGWETTAPGFQASSSTHIHGMHQNQPKSLQSIDKMQQTSQPYTSFTRYNRLSNRLYNRLYRVNKHPTGCRTGGQTGLTNGWMFVYTIQLVVKPVDNQFDNRVEWTATVHLTVLNEQPLWVQPVVKLGCTTGLTTGCIYNKAGC